MNTSSATRFKIPRDVWIGLLAGAGAVAYWRVADDIPISPLDGVVNAALLPKALATAMIVFSALLIARALIIEFFAMRAARSAQPAGTAAPAGSAPEEREGLTFTPRQHLKALGVLALGVAYLLLLPIIGYVVAIFLLVLAVSIYIGARPGLRPVGVAALVAGGFYMLFGVVLGIPMPAGIWGSLLG
jgi:putative tricarboxylic transport membrane protein